MSTYREIIGKKIKKVSSDPSSGTEGEMWYNSTTGTLRGPAILSAWTSCGPLISVQGDMANVGIQTASLCAGGSNNPGSENVNITQEGNGTGFSQGGNLNTERRGCAGFGVQTSAVCFGGYTTTYDNNTEEYNGTAWTNGNDTPLSPGTASWNSGGTLTAGLGYGGSDLGPGATPPANRGKQTIEYDGTNWADGNQMTRSSGDGMTGFGIQTAALAAGQSTPPGSPSATTVVENYDGTNWTSGTVTPTAVAYCGSGGTQTAGIIFGGVSEGSPGYPTKVTTTLSWNGTSWSSEPALATARMGTWGGPVGSSTASQLMGGNNGPGVIANVENFDSSIIAVTAAAWSSGTNMGSARYGGQYFGTGQTSQVAVGGHIPGSPDFTATSETYNGTTWTEGNNINTARYNGGSGGTETAGLVVCGRDPSSAPAPQVYFANVEEYNGTSYSEQTDCPEAAYGKAGAGTQTAWVGVGGFLGPAPSPSYSTASQEYDGTNWTAGGAAPFKAVSMSGVGITTAAVIFGQQQDPAANDKVYDYNGTSWTAANDMNRNHGGQHSACGTVTSALVAGGSGPYADSAVSELYDGTTWSTSATLGQSGLRGGKGTSSPAAIGAGGYGPGFFNATEEFTAETEATNIETFTTS